MNINTSEQLKQELSNAQLDTHDLDSVVHDAASALASNANNEGLSGQIQFLTSHGWSYDDILKAAKEQ